MSQKSDDWTWLDQVVGPVDEDFERAALDRPRESQQHPGLDDLFE
jgi:antitoxin VapB